MVELHAYKESIIKLPSLHTMGREGKPPHKIQHTIVLCWLPPGCQGEGYSQSPGQIHYFSHQLGTGWEAHVLDQEGEICLDLGEGGTYHHLQMVQKDLI